jgi:hypothetical protein
MIDSCQDYGRLHQRKEGQGLVTTALPFFSVSLAPEELLR